MEIKTTKDFEKTFRLKESIGFPSTEGLNKRWIAVDDMIKLVNYSRNHCRGSPDEMEKILLDKLGIE